jgi:hypothetical protein
VPVDDPSAHASANELIREHQAGGTGADDEDISIQALSYVENASAAG